MFKLLVSLCFSLCSLSAIGMNNLKEAKNQENATSIINDVLPLNLRTVPTTNDLFLNDYYDNYYFINSFENYGRNVKGSCTQLALAQLLSFLDTYWDDTLVPENYEKYSYLPTNQLSYTVDSPGIKRESLALVGGLSTYDYYWNVVDDYSDEYFHLLMIKIGYEQFGYYNFSDPVNPAALYDGQINSIADYYLFTYLGKSRDNYTIGSSTSTSANNRNYIINKVKTGIPVLVRASLPGGGHAMVAYDYDEDNDQLYFHAGWESDSVHRSESSLGVTKYFDAMIITPNTNHIHTSNYLYADDDLTNYHCPCNFVIPTEISVSNNYLDTVPTFKWNSLIKDKWFQNIGLHHEFSILRSNHYEVFTIEDIYDNEVTFNSTNWGNTINIATPYYYAYVGLASDIDPYWDDYYCLQLFREPNRYLNKSSFLPSDWGFAARYYFSNELDSYHLSIEPERRYTTATINGLTVTTDRLRCGYIEQSYVVLSPRRENAGRAYFEMNFNAAVYSFMYRACMWSSSENLDGIAIIQTKNSNGVWTTLKDIPISSLPTKANGVAQFVEQTSQGIYGLRFETTATATGTRNKGRLCLDDIAFSTQSGTQNNSYTSFDYSTKN